MQIYNPAFESPKKCQNGIILYRNIFLILILNFGLIYFKFQLAVIFCRQVILIFYQKDTEGQVENY